MGRGFSVASGVLVLCASMGLAQGETTVETATAATTVDTVTGGSVTGETAASAAKPPFFTDHARGWHWYERMLVKEKKKEKKRFATQALSHPSPSDPVTGAPRVGDLSLGDSVTDPSAVVEKYRKMIERAKDQALMDPSPENLYRYMALQQDAMARSHRFAERWQQLLLKRPELDDTVKFPTTQGARHVAYAQEKKTVFDQIRALKDTHGLYFFFKQTCPYCQGFAPIVKAFAQKHGWTVFAISLDGSFLPDFPQAVTDNGFGARLGVTSLPALFAANPSAGQIIPLAHSMISQAEIEARILMLTQGNQLQGAQAQGVHTQRRKE